MHEYWQRVTEGRQLDQLWAQFKTEAKESYGLFSREVDWNAVNREKRMKRPFRAAWALLQVLMMKLTPARRVLLLAALVCLIYPTPALIVRDLFEPRNRGFEGFAELYALGGVLLFVLLALELADRVTMKRDLEIAREIQRWLVPENPPEVPGADIAFASRPANTVAGDYYDAFLRNVSVGDATASRLLVVVADVAGKSVPAALLMATLQASLRALSGAGRSLREVVEGINRYACEHSLGGLRFTTAFFGEWDPATRQFEYINAGHNPPILRRGPGRIERLAEGGLPLGIALDDGALRHYESGITRIDAGDALVIFTDGVVEAVDAEEKEFGEGRLLESLESCAPSAAKDLLREIMADVDRFVAGARQHDDITCLVMKAV
ncbi:MAG: PP2C family protein-serine/threonine phosphatase [Candidatus Acidiferrales bacterium]